MAHQSQEFMVTNLCPAVDPNMDWCAQRDTSEHGGTNTFGYAYHFDLQNTDHQISNMKWDNPEVLVEEVPCHSDFPNLWNHGK